jgi:hypothetical protein
MPFLNKAGFAGDVERFDFAVDGVTSISCDIVRIRGVLHWTRADLCSTNTRSVQKVSSLLHLFHVLS